MCVLCLPCCVAYHLYRKKKYGAVSSAPRHASDGTTIRYVGSRSGDGGARVEYPTLTPDQPELPPGPSSSQEHFDAGYDQDTTPLWPTTHPNP